MSTIKTAKPRKGRGKAKKSLMLIDAAIQILEAIQPCSVRAVCYQLFSRPCKIRFSKSTLHGVTKNQFFDDHVSDPIARSRSPYAPSRII